MKVPTNLVPSRLTVDTRSSGDVGQKDVFQNTLVSVGVNKCTTDTDKNTKSPSWLVDSVPGLPDVSEFLNDSPGNTFLKRLRTKLLICSIMYTLEIMS